ncbi:MAG: DUF1858 domain-containing protein [Peptostreptococcales bacterium]
MTYNKNITKDTSIAEIIEEGLVDILVKNGLNCLGCPASYHESLQEAAKGHGVELEKILDELNKED